MNQPRCLSIAIALLATFSALKVVVAEQAAPASPAALASDVKVTARIDKSTAAVAEPFQLSITVKAPRGTRIEWPSLGQKLGDLEIRHTVRTDDVPSRDTTGQREWILRLTLDSIKTGELTIPPVTVRYALPSTSTDLQSLQTQPQHVIINSVLEDRPDPTHFRDIKQTVDVAIPPASTSWLIWGGAAVGVIAASSLLVLGLKRRRAGLAPSAWALRSIAELEADQADESAIPNTFDKVLEIVREYFELEFDIRALPSTTQEFLTDASTEIGLPQQTAERLKWLATVADEVKFARLTIGPQHLQQAFAQSRSIISESVEHQRALTKEAA
jgi:hypothetical protein